MSIPGSRPLTHIVHQIRKWTYNLSVSSQNAITTRSKVMPGSLKRKESKSLRELTRARTNNMQKLRKLAVRQDHFLWSSSGARAALVVGPSNVGFAPPTFSISIPPPCCSATNGACVWPLLAPNLWSPSSYFLLKCRYVGGRGRTSTATQFLIKFLWLKGRCRSFLGNLCEFKSSLVVSPRPVK